MQETTAAFLTATLTSRISGSTSSEQQTTGASSEQQTTGAYGSLPPTNDLSLSLDAELSKNSEARVKRNSHDDLCEVNSIMPWILVVVLTNLGWF